jgi:hypothetical protein
VGLGRYLLGSGKTDYFPEEMLQRLIVTLDCRASSPVSGRYMEGIGGNRWNVTD